MNLMLGDCLERMKEIPDGSVDMILTDPPYGTTSCKWDSIIDLPLMWEQLKRIIKPNGAIVMTASQPFTTTLIGSNMKMFKYCWVWDKKKHANAMLAKIQPLKIHEDIVVFSLKKHYYQPIKEQRKPRVDKQSLIKNGDNFGGKSVLRKYENSQGLYYPKSILEVSNANQKGKVHPTQKPVALMEYLIKTYTNESETVLDFTMGSGSTGVAAKNLNREFIGIEMDEGYFKIAQDRIQNA
jgi:site-specific DNA-methyltransferase (adenine-specific)